MRSRVLIFSAILIVSAGLSGCGGTAPANSNANTTNANTAAANANNNPLETTTPAPEQTTNNAPTLTPVFKAYCTAWVKNDEAALRQVYSTATIKHFEEEMKKEKAKTLIKYLEYTDRVSGTPCEVTNEKISGDRAVAKIRSDKYPNGIEVVFVKENGEWKLTNEAPMLSKPPAANTAPPK